MNTIKGLFFDLDGTLVDTHESNYRAYRDAVRTIVGNELGDELKNRIMRGETSLVFLAVLLPSASEEEINKINQKKRELYPAHLDVSRLNENLLAFLSQMSRDHLTALVTTAKRTNAEAVLKVHNINDTFNVTIYGDDVSAMKPDPEAYLLALEKTGLAPNEVIAFEDSEKGIEAAHAAGIATIHIRKFS